MKGGAQLSADQEGEAVILVATSLHELCDDGFWVLCDDES